MSSLWAISQVIASMIVKSSLFDGFCVQISTTISCYICGHNWSLPIDQQLLLLSKPPRQQSRMIRSIRNVNFWAKQLIIDINNENIRLNVKVVVCMGLQRYRDIKSCNSAISTIRCISPSRLIVSTCFVQLYSRENLYYQAHAIHSFLLNSHYWTAENFKVLACRHWKIFVPLSTVKITTKHIASLSTWNLLSKHDANNECPQLRVASKIIVLVFLADYSVTTVSLRHLSKLQTTRSNFECCMTTLL